MMVRYCLIVLSHRFVLQRKQLVFNSVHVVCSHVKQYSCRQCIYILYSHRLLCFSFNSIAVKNSFHGSLFCCFLQSLSGNLEPRCLLPFIEKATEIIADTRVIGSVVVCNVLCKIFDSRHGELGEQVMSNILYFTVSIEIVSLQIDYIFSIMLNKYNQISNEDVLRALRAAFKQLSLSCSSRVFSTLMNFGVPFTK